jgi:hypothetical protein
MKLRWNYGPESKEALEIPLGRTAEGIGDAFSLLDLSTKSEDHGCIPWYIVSLAMFFLSYKTRACANHTKEKKAVHK